MVDSYFRSNPVAIMRVPNPVISTNFGRQQQKPPKAFDCKSNINGVRFHMECVAQSVRARIAVVLLGHGQQHLKQADNLVVAGSSPATLHLFTASKHMLHHIFRQVAQR